MASAECTVPLRPDLVHQLPGILDDPANGGNGDGWVCAFPLPVAVQGGGEFTIYQFFENNLPAQSRP